MDTTSPAISQPPTHRPRRAGERVRIYQLLPRLFGNVNETRRPNGTLAENGVGKFADIGEAALASIRAMGFTHLWLTGVIRQATSTDYSAIGLPPDDPDLLKGRAGSPYAITDYFDVCPDHAVEPRERLAEFCALLGRIHAVGLRAIIDLVPNHVARSYRSTLRPDLDFGARDDRTKFFSPANDFFWLQRDSPGGGPPLRLPTVTADGEPLSATCKVVGGCDGRYAGEMDCGRVTGNNVVSWSPSLNDWYETAKLNYGFDFTTGAREFPHAAAPGKSLPGVWPKIDAVLAHWQALGVDGFRCDMAHMVPPEFWAWAIARARGRVPDTFFAAEAYDNDPMKACDGNVLEALIGAGFDAVYDDPSYKILKGIYDGPKWANDLDGVLAANAPALMFRHALHYAENHDEVRLAGANQWGGVGMNVGRVVSAILFGISRGPVLLYSGQEVGEPAAGAEGFGGDDARTTIFDYWSMPELVKWVNAHAFDGGRLAVVQRELRAFYGRLVRLVGEPAFRDGEFRSLNVVNIDNPEFGRLPGEPASGHWLYAFLRHDAASGQRFLVAANLHARETLRDVRIRWPHEIADWLGLREGGGCTLIERLGATPAATASFDGADVVKIAAIPPLTPLYFEMRDSA